MKKSLAALIIGSFLLLTFSQAGFADFRGSPRSNDLTSLRQWGKFSGLTAFLLFENNNFALYRVPFIRSAHTQAYQKPTDYFSFVDALLTAKDLFWEEIEKWNPISSLSGTPVFKQTRANTLAAFDSRNSVAQNHVGIFLNHGVGNRKIWNISINLGIALQDDHSIGPDDSISDDLFPKLGIVPGNQRADLLDQLRNASPFIGFGISYRF
jgi:hypothetical protein